MLQLNGSVLLLTVQAVWRKGLRPALRHDRFIFPVIGFAGLLAAWWLVATYATSLLPTPIQALTDNWDCIIHLFYRRGPGDFIPGTLRVPGDREPDENLSATR